MNLPEPQIVLDRESGSRFCGSLPGVGNPQEDPGFAGHGSHDVDDLVPELLQEPIQGASHVDNQHSPPAGAGLDALHGFGELFWQSRFDRQAYPKVGIADHGASVSGTGYPTRADGPK